MLRADDPSLIWRIEMADEQFDPSSKNVDEVNAHLVAHKDDDGEVERVLAAETAGQNRKTVTDPRKPAESPQNQAPRSDETVTDGPQEPTDSAYGGERTKAGSKPYWYEETQGPAPEGAEKSYRVVRVVR